MFCHKQYLLLLFLSMISFFVRYIEGYCYSRFTDSPVVTEFQFNELRVSWKGIVKNKYCIDQFWVKYWEKSKPIAYKMSHLVGYGTDYIDIKVLPGTVYVIEVLGSKGSNGGLSSPRSEFRTRQINGSSVNPEGKFYLEYFTY